MTDRELLERAANAAGLLFDWMPYPAIHQLGRNWVEWNPLTDDGDALRLAVKLGLAIGSASYTSIHVYRQGTHVFASEGSSPDPYAATRRAIVRAAAEMEQS